MPFTSHFSKLIERRNQLIIQRLPRRPQNKSDVLLLRVGDQLFHVHFRHDFQQIAQLVPAFIQNDVRNLIFRREVDEVLVRLRVDARLKIHAIQIQSFHQSHATFPGLIHEVS